MAEDYVAMCAECSKPVDRKDLQYVNGSSYHTPCASNPHADTHTNAEARALKLDIITLKNLQSRLSPSRKTPVKRTVKKKSVSKRKTIKRTVKRKTISKRKTSKRTAVSKRKTAKRTVKRKSSTVKKRHSRR